MKQQTNTASPLAQLFSAVIARDEAERAIDFARLQAIANHTRAKNEALDHAADCIANSDGWDEETLSHNIESNFPDLTVDDCDEIARAALSKAGSA